MLRASFTTAILLVTAVSFMSATSIPGVSGGAKRYTVNSTIGKSVADFVSDAPAEKINGTSDGVSGTFSFDPANIEATTGAIDVQVLSMKTANSKRDEHMYSEMWLDAAKFPKITFTVTSLKDVKVSSVDGKTVVKANAVGTFTCHGVTKAASAPVTLTFIPESAETKKRASGNFIMVETSFAVALADHNVVGKAGVVGKSVGQSIAVSAKLFANS